MKSMLLCTAAALFISTQALASSLCFERPQSLANTSLPAELRIDALDIGGKENSEDFSLKIDGTIKGEFTAKEVGSSDEEIVFKSVIFADGEYAGICRTDREETLTVIIDITSANESDLVKVVGYSSYTMDNCHTEAEVTTELYTPVACK